MAHFAEIDDTNTVLRVTVVNNEDMLDDQGNEVEALGARLCHDLMGGRWVQCSYSGSIRGAYPGIGWAYDAASDVFLPPTQSEDDSSQASG